jgi:histidinol-phosphate phosphatase family protein
VCGRPFLAYLLDQLADAGVERAILATGYLGDQVRDTFGQYYRGLRLRYSQEPAPLGTAGALRLAASGLPQALVMKGDSFCDVDVASALLDHTHGGAPNSIVVKAVDDVRRFGSVEAGTGGVVKAFIEKGSGGSIHPVRGLINAGIYFLSSELIASIAEDSQVSLEHEVFPRYTDGRLRGILTPGAFIDIGTPDALAAANTFFQDRSAACKRIIFLDRDGTLNVERRHLSGVDGMELLPGVCEGVRTLRALGWPLVVVTNQSVVGRGMCSPETLERIDARLVELLAAEGAAVDAFYTCPHSPEDGCACRKPGVGLLKAAARVFGGDLKRSFLVGDKWSDIQAGSRVGAVTLLVRTGHGAEPDQTLKSQPDFIVPDLRSAADQICRILQGERAPN